MESFFILITEPIINRIVLEDLIKKEEDPRKNILLETLIMQPKLEKK